MWRLIYTAVYSLIISFASAQGLDSTFALAEDLYQQERYGEAIYFYERARFFSDKELETDILFKMGQSYRRSAEPEKALAYFDRVYFTAKDQKLKQEAILAKVQSLVQMRSFTQALAEIYSAQAANDEQEQRLSFYEGICHYARMDFSSAHEAFIAATGKDSAKARAIVALYADTSSLYRPRPKVAKRLSYFMPGLGQLYAGDVKNGLNSMALNAAMVALTINVGVNYSTFDAFLAVFPWVQRYYLGGTDKAEMIAQDKLLENRQDFYLEIMEIFDDQVKGSSAPQ